jgi:transglutaminase-like putative cysteine protease
MIDHHRIDWDNVTVATYHLRQRFRYEYPGPIFDLSQRMVVLPPAVHGDQRRLSGSLTVLPHAPAQTTDDGFGNEVVSFFAARIDGAFEVAVDATVRRTRTSREPVLPATASDERAYRESGPLTAADDDIREVATGLRVRHRNDRELAEAIAAFVHGELKYAKGVTDVSTTAANAFALKRGVCQDFAHVALAIARACGLPARYVSGHLLGEGATHAWVEFIVPAGRNRATALSFDPTHGVRTSLRYVVVAVGGDYADVAPTSGAYRAPYQGTLKASTHVHVGDVGY